MPVTQCPVSGCGRWSPRCNSHHHPLLLLMRSISTPPPALQPSSHPHPRSTPPPLPTPVLPLATVLPSSFCRRNISTTATFAPPLLLLIPLIVQLSLRCPTSPALLSIDCTVRLAGCRSPSRESRRWGGRHPRQQLTAERENVMVVLLVITRLCCRSIDRLFLML